MLTILIRLTHQIQIMKPIFIVAIVITILTYCKGSPQQQGSQHQHHHHDHQHNHHRHNHDDNHEDHSSVNSIDEQINDHISSGSIQQKQQKLSHFFESCQKEIDQWVYIPREKPLEQVLKQCGAQDNAEYLLQFYSKLAKFNSTFLKQHINLMIKEFKQNRIVPQLLNCIVKQRTIENAYLQEKKKYKYIAQFLNKYPDQGKDVFSVHSNFSLVGKKTCRFFKALFEYYYLQVLNPSQTLSTQFLRALTVRSPVFEHEDIAFCIEIQSVGKLSQELEDIDINNIYVKIPNIYNSLRFLKLKQKCKDAHNRKLINNLHSSLQGLDMFIIMYKDYEPFVEIAAQKLVQTQIRLLARRFADIIADRDYYLKLSKQKLQNDL